VPPRDRKPVCSLFGRYEMCHFRSALDLKMRDVFLQYAICVGHPLMLPQMFEPGFHREKIASLMSGVSPSSRVCDKACLHKGRLPWHGAGDHDSVSEKTTMRVMEIRDAWGLEHLKPGDGSDPTAGPGEFVIALMPHP
jgi:hypothetical protein